MNNLDPSSNQNAAQQNLVMWPNPGLDKQMLTFLKGADGVKLELMHKTKYWLMKSEVGT